MFFKREKTIKIKIAYWLSRIFEPLLWVGLLGVAMIFSPYLDNYNRFFWAVELLIFLVGLPLLTLWLAFKKGKITDIDFTKKEERTPYLLVILFYWAMGMILTWGLGGPVVIIKILLLAVIVGLAVLVINFYYKISNHALGFVISCLLFNELYSWHYWWLLLFAPVIFWSRWVQKKHTWGQLVLGTGLAIVGWGIWRIF
ncbi:MAG TPA: hypothetical protein P5267_02045 [Patescibacteria group bacterium]|nr:hypothetical protein [Patescibacteria group bacterium]